MTDTPVALADGLIAERVRLAAEEAWEEAMEARDSFVPETRMADVMLEAAEVIRAARRPSPLTREAPTSGIYIHGPLGEALRPALPEPAEVEWEYGRQDPRNMIYRLRRQAQIAKDEAERILAAPDDEFVVETYLGVYVQRKRERLWPPTVTGVRK